jgi:hypothetical protein
VTAACSVGRIPVVSWPSFACFTCLPKGCLYLATDDSPTVEPN